MEGVPEPTMRLHALMPVLALLTLGCVSNDDSYVRYRYTNAVIMADVDGDGRSDILSCNGVYENDVATYGYLSVSLQTAPGTFATPVRYTVGGDPAALAVGQLNGDARLDVVVANAASGTLTVLFQSATTAGTFEAPLTLACGNVSPLDVAVGDLNQDSRPDLAVAAAGANTALIFHQGTTPGTFGAPVSLALSGDPRAAVVADLNGDLRPDLAVSTTADVVSVLYQNPSAGTFATAVDLPVGARPVGLKAVDLTGSGRLDLLTCNYRANATNGLSVIRQTAPGVFAAAVNHALDDYYAAGLALSDVDGDGRLDVAVACAGLSGDPGSVAMLLQNPAAPGTFLAPVNYGGYMGGLGVALGDTNADGLPDLVVADGLPYRRLQVSTTPGTFGAGTFIGY